MAESWDTQKIREAFIYDGGESEYHDPINGAQSQRRVAGDIFDTWLAAHDAEMAVKAETTEWEYGVNDYRAPGYIIIGDDPLPTKDRVGYYGTRPLIRRRKAGPWETVKEETRG